MSLDALRGADMLFIMGFSGAVVAFCQLLGFGKDSWLAAQMTHVAWHGFRHHDTIFPLFLFLAGVSWPYSLAGQRERGRSTMRIVGKILLRALCLFVLGLATEKAFWRFDVPSFRYDTILAHIGICWGAAALLTLFVRNFWARLAVAVGILAGHFLLLASVTAPDAAALLSHSDPAIAKIATSYAATGTDGFSVAGNIAGWLDRTFMPGVLYENIFDPDGLLAKLPGIVTALMGVWAGEILRRNDLAGGRKTLILLVAALATFALCMAWKPWCPVNKKLWTSTFILAAGAYSFAALALFYWLVDVKGWRRWTFFFRVIGMNSIAIYMLMSFAGFYSMSHRFFAGVAGFGGEHWADFVYAIGQVVLEWLVLLYMYRKKTFLKV